MAAWQLLGHCASVAGLAPKKWWLLFPTPNERDSYQLADPLSIFVAQRQDSIHQLSEWIFSTSFGRELTRSEQVAQINLQRRGDRLQSVETRRQISPFNPTDRLKRLADPIA